MAATKKVTKKATKKKTEQIEKIPFWIFFIPLLIIIEFNMLMFASIGIILIIIYLIVINTGLKTIGFRTRYEYLDVAIYTLAFLFFFSGHTTAGEGFSLIYYSAAALLFGFQLLLIWLYKIVAAENATLGSILYLLAHAILLIIGIIFVSLPYLTASII